MSKKILIAFLALFIIVPVSIVTVLTLNKQSDKKQEAITEVSYEEVQTMLKDGKTFILYIGREDCSTCQLFEPELHKYLDENPDVNIYYFSTKSFRDASKENETAKETYERLRTEFQFQWTPTLHLIEKGQFASTFQFLDDTYYSTEDAAKKQEIFDLAVKDFRTWIEKAVTVK